MRRRWSVPVLGVAAAILFGYVATHPDPVQRPEPPPAATPSPAPVLPRLIGADGSAPEGLRVLVSGRYPQILDLATGQGRPVPGLRLTAGQRAALQPVPAGTVAAVTSPRLTQIRTVLLPAAGGRPVPLGTDVAVVPAQRGTDLYVASGLPGSTRVAVTAPSGRIRRSWTAGGRLIPLRDTTAGLVVLQVGDLQVTELRLLDPATGATRRRLAVGSIVVTVGPASIAFVSASCVRQCPVTVTGLADGRSRYYQMPTITGNPARGAFSPDGRWLALGVPGQYRNGRLVVVPGFAEVLDLVTGAVSRVPGVETPAERSPDLSWFGPTLVLGVWSDERGRVATWNPDRPGDGLTVLPADPPGDQALSSVTVLP